MRTPLYRGALRHAIPRSKLTPEREIGTCLPRTNRPGLQARRYLRSVENNNREECFFSGHRICVEAEEVPDGGWTWRYVVVNELTASKSAETCFPDAQAALREGMAAARAQVDAFLGTSRISGATEGAVRDHARSGPPSGEAPADQ